MTKESSCFETPTKPVVASAELAPGFRFHPTDVELVSYYLKRKVTGKAIRVDAISEIDLYRAEPWDLPPLSRLRSRDLEWYFFTTLDHKYSNRCRTNRSTIEGYWKTTGKDRPIQHHSRKVGMKKTLVYHSGRAPRGQRTNWVMHEYRLEDENLTRSGILQDGYVLCRIFQKSGPGPQNGAQYGAPFIEEEWEREEEEDAKPVSVNVVADDGLIEPSGQDFVQLGDFLQNSNSGIQHIDAFPSRSAELELGSLSEDSSNFVEEVFKDPNFLADKTEDVDFSVPQINKCSDTQLNCVSMQSNGYVQLEDILSEGNPNSSSDDSIHCPSVVDGVFKSEIFLKIPDEGNLLNTNCAINQPEHLQLYSAVEHDMFPQPFDPLDDAPWEYPSNCMAEDSVYYDTFSHDVPYSEDGLTVETSMPTVTEFDFSEDLMLYYEAAEDKSNPSPEVVGSSSSSGKEVISARENLIQQSSLGKLRTGDGISSILNDDLTDAELKIGSKSNTLGKRLASMLNSISAPPAFADEVTLIGKTARQIPAASLHLTANVIQLGNLRAVDYYYADSWTLQKKSGRIAGKSRKTALGLIYSTFRRCRFPLFFLSAAVFGLSCKLGFLELPHCLIRG